MAVLVLHALLLSAGHFGETAPTLNAHQYALLCVDKSKAELSWRQSCTVPLRTAKYSVKSACAMRPRWPVLSSLCRSARTASPLWDVVFEGLQGTGHERVGGGQVSALHPGRQATRTLQVYAAWQHGHTVGERSARWQRLRPRGSRRMRTAARWLALVYVHQGPVLLVCQLHRLRVCGIGERQACRCAPVRATPQGGPT